MRDKSYFRFERLRLEHDIFESPVRVKVYPYPGQRNL